MQNAKETPNGTEGEPNRRWCSMQTPFVHYMLKNWTEKLACLTGVMFVLISLNNSINLCVSQFSVFTSILIEDFRCMVFFASHFVFCVALARQEKKLPSFDLHLGIQEEKTKPIIWLMHYKKKWKRMNKRQFNSKQFATICFCISCICISACIQKKIRENMKRKKKYKMNKSSIMLH